MSKEIYKAEMDSIIVKFLNNEANFKELEILEDWLKTPNNIDVFNNYVKVKYISSACINAYNINKTKESIKSKIKILERKKTSLVFRKIAVAASVILFAGISLVYFNKKEPNNLGDIKVVNQIKVGSTKAILTLDNGNDIVLDKGAKILTEEATSSDKGLIYSKLKESEVSKYNYLTIPRGGEYFVKLSDGTKIWLNSETKLKYPVQFSENEPRIVELLYGEAFFDVTHLSGDNGNKFLVLNRNQEIEVVGTEFNIKSYKDENIVYTTLVEGKIILHVLGENKNLVPNQQAQLNIYTNTLEVNKVDVYNEISWKEGVFSFEGKSLKEIMKVLSRWYDIDVIFENKLLENEEFIGVLDKNQKIENILSSIKQFGIIKEYVIENKTIIIR